MTWDEGLSGAHKDIAASTERRIGVLAGPGTGKTSRGLMRRVVRLLEGGADGKAILLLSFTRVAAADLRDKIAELQAPGSENVRATTLHSYCFGLLNKESVLTITGRVPRILLDHEVDLLLRDIGGDFGNIHERRRRLEAFVAGWARGTEDHPGIATTNEDRAFEFAVMRWLREHRAMLIGEVVPEAFRYLSTNPGADELKAFQHVIVDEYQDLNHLEQNLLDVLTANGNLCVAGDDDQSIYSVRYANPSGILAFLERKDVETHSINVCGRCPENILSMANSLIKQTPGRTKPDLVPKDAGSVGAVAIVQWDTVDAEVDGLVSVIAGAIQAKRREPGEILILTNWRKIGERIRSRLNELGFRTRSFFTEEELKSDEGTEALALLRLLVDDSDAPALRVLLGMGDSTGRSAAYQRLLEFCRAQTTTPRDVLGRLSRGERLGLNIPALVERYDHVVGKVEQLRALTLVELVDELFPPEQESTEDLRAVALDALAEVDTPSTLLQSIVEAVTQDDVPQNPDFVRVMSLHKSKGLTSRSVFIAGAVHGILPTLASDEPEAIQAATSEGRRLFYVAITRATDELIISGATSMDLADANGRGVKYDRGSIRASGDGRHVIKTISSPYIAELGSSAPAAITGETWLRDRAE